MQGKGIAQRKFRLGGIFTAAIFCVQLFQSSPAMAICNNPGGNAGDQIYNTTYNVMQYCDGLQWIAMGGEGGPWQKQGEDIFFTGSGNVGIGTDTPTSALEVRGIITAGNVIRLANEVGTSCVVAGEIRYNSTDKSVEVCDGSGWQSAGASKFSEVGAVLYVGADQKIARDVTNFAWDVANSALTVGKKIKFKSMPGGVPLGDKSANFVLSDITDVNVSGAEDGFSLVYNGSAWAAKSMRTLNDLTDVDISGMVTNDTLTYNGTLWVNKPSAWIKSGTNAYYADAGNVGIGTSAPLSKLGVAGGLAVGASYAGVSAAPTNGAIFEGQVGIGTVTPSEALHVYNGKIKIDNANNNFDLAVQSVAGNGAFINFTRKSDNTRWHISGPRAVGGETDGNLTFFNYDAGSTTAINTLTLTKDNTGIGIITPTTKLDVNGDTYVRGALGVGVAPYSPSYKLRVSTYGTSGTILLDNRQMISFNSFGAMPIANQQIVGAIGFTAMGQSHGQFHYRASKGFEFLNVSSDAPNIDHVSSNFAPVYLGQVYTGACSQCSDIRLKKNISPLDGDALKKIISLSGITYEWKSPEERTIAKEATLPLHKKRMGLIAQDVEKVFPELVVKNKDFDGVRTNNGGEIKTIDYSGLSAPIIEAIKELAADNDAKGKRIDDLEKKLELLSVELQKIKESGK